MVPEICNLILGYQAGKMEEWRAKVVIIFTYIFILFNFFTYFCFGGTPGCVLGLLLALHSEIAPGGT